MAPTLSMSSGRRGPGPAEAVAVLAALVALELAGAAFLPRAAYSRGGLWVTGLLRTVEVGLCLGYWHVRRWTLEDLGLRGVRVRPGLLGGGAVAMGFALLVAATETAARLFLGRSWLSLLSGPPVGGAQLAALLTVGGIVGPFFEELLFRGFLYGGLRRRVGPVAAALASTLLFAAAHGLTARVPWVQAVGGLLFCAAYELTGSLWAPFVVHAAGNVALFLLPLGLR